VNGALCMILFVAAIVALAGLALDLYEAWVERQWRYQQRAASSLARHQAMNRLYAAYLFAIHRLRAEANRRAWDEGEDER
jgi:hypothetical protein